MRKIIKRMTDEMNLRNYSPRTIKIYNSCIEKAAKHFRKNPTILTTNQLRKFFVNLHNNGATPSILHLYYNSFAFLYTLYGRRHILAPIPRPKVKIKTPTVFDKSEVLLFLSAFTNVRYHAFFTLIYSAGLRLSEAVNLTVNDIDFIRKTIRIIISKNNKGRYTILADNTALILKHYMKIYKPENYLFCALKNKHVKFNARHAQEIFHRQLMLSGIMKKASIHTLRHSFATHLLENDVNLFVIMKLMGHASLETTQRYLQLRRFDLLQIQSPFDSFPQTSNLTGIRPHQAR